MAIRYFAGAVILLTALSGFAQNRDLSLLALIDQLRERGYTIIYSNSVLDVRSTVEAGAITIEALEAVLRDQGLQLQQRGSAWVVAISEDSHVSQKISEVRPEVAPPLETVIVTGTRHRFPHTDIVSSSRSFRPEDLSLVPAMASDAMRIALRLPGVSSVGVSAKPRIRGGLQDELLVIQDGVELLEPFHLADYHSAYSAIDYRTIESMDIYTGGFPSRYGNRMSGVMDISNNWAEGEYNTDLGVSTFANFINSRGEFGESMPTQWSLSLREGDLSDLTDYIETRSGKPEYLDVAARLNITLSASTKLALGVVHAKDDISFLDEEESATSRIDTDYVWLGLDWRPSEVLRSRFTLSWLDFQRRKMLTSFEPDEEEKGGSLDHRQDIQRLAFRNDFSALIGGQFFEFGWQAEYNRGSYRHISAVDRGELAEITGSQQSVLRNIRVKPDGWSGGVYGQMEWQASDRLTVQPSARWDYQNYYLERGSDFQISPRLGLAYQVNEETRLRFSFGRFHQPESIQELQVIDGVTEFFSPQSSDQIVAGLEWEKDEIAFVGEVYHKRYGKQKGRFENLFNPFVLLPEMEPDRVELRPSKALARGLDLELRYEFLPRMTGNIGYSYMDADDRIGGEWIAWRWSQRHTVNTGLVWEGESYSVSLALTWHSGWRSSKIPDRVSQGARIPIESALNNVELDDYVSLDFSARKSWEIGKTRLQIYADIVNLTNRRNAAGIDYDVEEVDGGFELTPDHENLLRRVPSFGITISF